MRTGKLLTLLSLLIFCSIPRSLYSQKAYINTPFGLYELTNTTTGCNTVALTNACNETGFILSLALYKDTVYYITLNGELKRFKIGVPGSCQFMTTLPAYNSMTIDKNGIIYLADDRLVRYNPYTGETSTLGLLPFASGGDLFFFNDKLLLAGIPPGIYEINIANPPTSTLYMSTNNISFYGLISFPTSCTSIGYFGLAPAPNGTTMYQLDLVNKTVVGSACALPLNVYDAASVTEGGTNDGIIVTALNRKHPCPPAATGSVAVDAISTFPGTLTYTLDNTVTNASGVFAGLTPGNHTIRINSSAGCSKDTSFTINTGLDPLIPIQKINPDNCDNNNGSVSLTATSANLPIRYTLINTGITQPSGNFNNLGAGIYTFNIADAGGCSKDTTIELVYNQRSFVNTINTVHSHCNLGNGSLKVVLDASATNATVSLNNGPFSASLERTNLVPGNYYIQVKSGLNCFFDTSIVIQNINDAKPQILVQSSNQFCFTNNGSITLNVTGNDAPYTFQLNDDPFTPQNQFTGLAPANYALTIKNKFECRWDTFAVVTAYPRHPVAADIQYVNPTCTGMNDGSLKVTVTGAQGPYSLYINGQRYNSGQNITGLTEGNYTIAIENLEQCRVDTVTQELKIPYEAHCNQVYVPTAFTPNGDGKNDFLRPGYSSFIKNLTLSIFNRYGQKIYEGRTGSISWDGTFKGIKQIPGVYVYMATYTDYFGASKTLKGTVVLIR